MQCTARASRTQTRYTGVLLLGVRVFFLVKDALGHNDGNCAIVAGYFG